MEEHVIFFLDFLGFADAVNTWSDEKLNQVGVLLNHMAKMRSNGWYTVEPTENGKRINHAPAISTFSDHLVISFKVKDLLKTWEPNTDREDLYSLPLMQMQRTIGALAAGALDLGLLIRGGITVGPLFHQDGVVIGKAMLEAHNLESRVASYPRIVISKKVYSKFRTTPREKFIITDDDGISHYNYFTHMILTETGAETVEEAMTPIAAGYDRTMRLINENIKKFEEAEAWNQLAKWSWMKQRMTKIRATLNEAFFRKIA